MAGVSVGSAVVVGGGLRLVGGYVGAWPDQILLTYVEAARALGTTPLSILVRHILGNILSPVIVQVAVTLSYAVLIESALSFLSDGMWDLLDPRLRQP